MKCPKCNSENTGGALPPQCLAWKYRCADCGYFFNFPAREENELVTSLREGIEALKEGRIAATICSVLPGKGWQPIEDSLRERRLKPWNFADLEIEPATGTALRSAERLVGMLLAWGWPAPATLCNTGDGGVSFEWKGSGARVLAIEITAAGQGDARLFDGTKLVKRLAFDILKRENDGQAAEEQSRSHEDREGEGPAPSVVGSQ